MAVWTTKYVNSLPDSSFAYIDSNGRHLPYKDANGKIDLPHLRNALARASQVKGLSGDKLQSVLDKLRAALKKSNSNIPKGFVVECSELNPTDDWVQLIKYGEWPHPEHGNEVLTEERGRRFKENFDNNTVGRKISINYEHGRSFAHGTKAAATIEEVELREDGVYGRVDWTPTALSEIENGEWLYLSPEYYDEFDRDGDSIADVIWGAALTNTPVIYGIAPINCSTIYPDLEEDAKAEYADWEHSEPGTGTPPEPGKSGDNEPAPFYDPPSTYDQPDPEDNQVNEAELRALLGIGEDVDLNEHLTTLKADAGAYKEATSATAMSNIPKELQERLDRLENESRENAAKAFSAEYIAKGIPPVMREEIEAAHKELSTVGATASLSAVLDKMPKIKYNSEDGTSQVDPATGETPTGDDARKQFAAIQNKIAAEEKVDTRKAFSLAAQRNPELFQNAQEAAMAARRK